LLISLGKLVSFIECLFKSRKGDIAYAYIIMIVLGILGIILVLFIFRGGFNPLGEKVLLLGNQTAP